MTREQAIEERIREWLHEEASGQMPDWVLETTFERTRAERQPRAFPRWRSPSLSNTARVVLAAAVSMAVLLGITFSPGQNVAPPGACSTPLATPSPVAGSSAVAGASPLASASPVEFLWSATGGADGMRFARTRDGIVAGGVIAIDPSCRVWVADTGHDRFAIFDPEGSFVEYWGSAGIGAGQYNLRGMDGLGAVAFAPDGSFYVLDAGNHLVKHFDKDRSFIGSLGGSGTGPGQYLEPVALAVDATGVVYVRDDWRNVVEKYDEDGNSIGSFTPDAGSGPANGLAFDTQGNIYVTACCYADNAVRKLDASGTIIRIIGSAGPGDLVHLTGIAVDAAGRVYVARGPAASGDKIRLYDSDGDFLTSFGSPGSGDGQFGYGYPLGIALDGQGSVYVTDGAANRLEKFRLLPPLFP